MEHLSKEKKLVVVIGIQLHPHQMDLNLRLWLGIIISIHPQIQDLLG